MQAFSCYYWKCPHLTRCPCRDWNSINNFVPSLPTVRDPFGYHQEIETHDVTHWLQPITELESMRTVQLEAGLSGSGF